MFTLGRIGFWKHYGVLCMWMLCCWLLYQLTRPYDLFQSVSIHRDIKDVSTWFKQSQVKVQFRGPELYKKKGALFQEESYLPRIFRSSSLNLHTFHLINIVFWWRIFFRKHGKSTPTIGKTTMFWSPTLWSWRHNAGARELSANQMLQSMTTTCR